MPEATRLVSPMTPAESFKAALDFYANFFEHEPGTLALVADTVDPEGPGVFQKIGLCTLIGIEVTGGPRDGWDFWHHHDGWAIHYRGHGLQRILLYLSRRQDTDGVCRILSEGKWLFDKSHIREQVEAHLRTTFGPSIIPSKEAFSLRARLAALIQTVRAAQAGTAPPEEIIQMAAELAEIANRLRTPASLTRPAFLAAARSGMNQAMALSALTEIETAASAILKTRLGGKPPPKWCSPAQDSHLIPPDPFTKANEEEEPVDAVLCLQCGRRMVPREGLFEVLP